MVRVVDVRPGGLPPRPAPGQAGLGREAGDPERLQATGVGKAGGLVDHAKWDAG